MSRVTEDDRNRLGDYKAQAQRAELEESAGGDRESFLASLGIVCSFGSAVEAPLARAVQLMGKTNQFNLTTRRRSAGEIEEFASGARWAGDRGAGAGSVWGCGRGGAGAGADGWGGMRD